MYQICLFSTESQELKIVVQLPKTSAKLKKAKVFKVLHSTIANEFLVQYIHINTYEEYPHYIEFEEK